MFAALRAGEGGGLGAAPGGGSGAATPPLPRPPAVMGPGRPLDTAALAAAVGEVAAAAAAAAGGGRHLPAAALAAPVGMEE